VFVFLAVVFSGGFIFLGIGSGSTGITQVFQSIFNGSSASGSSLSALQKKTQEHPKDAAAWLAYANRLQQKDQPDEAAAAFTTYTKLKPKDTGVLLQLAGLYLQRAEDWQTLYNVSSTRTQALTPTSVLNPSSSSKLGQAIASVTTPLTSAVSAGSTADTNNEYSKVQTYLGQRLDVYKRLAAIDPQDATTQLSLAGAASDASDAKTAIAAYKSFLKLAPSDSQAPQARKALKSLLAQQQSSSQVVPAGGGTQIIQR
jgi:tetratricopeptide (TPR) repeat protein